MKLKYLIACSVMCAASPSLYAANTLDWGELKPEVVYNYEAMTPVMGSYTPAESGIIRCYSTGDQIAPYKDASHEIPYEANESFYGASGVKVRIYSVNAGETMYFYNAFPLDGGTFRISVGDEEIKLVDVSPAAGDNIVSLSTNYSATISFNIPIKCTKCKLSVNDVSAEVPSVVNNSYITINWFNTLYKWYEEGKIKAGDVLTLTVTGIRDVNNSSNRPDFGGGEDKLILNFTMAGKPAELVWESGTPNSGVPDFLTYYLPGSDQGIVTLTFSQDIDTRTLPIAELSYGDRDNIELGMYIDTPPVTVEGKSVIVNLQGVTRFPEEMVPGLPAQKYIDLKVYGIKSADGQYVLTGNSASPYSYGFAYTLKSVVYSVAADWLPAPGSELHAGEEMEIWVLNGQNIVFDSVDFSYIKDGKPAMVSVPYSDLKATVDSDDAMLYNLTAPLIDADADTDITVTFGGLICADGLNHDSDILVKYKSATSGVESIEMSNADNVYYDLTGRRVMAPAKGIYICNGKKVTVK